MSLRAFGFIALAGIVAAEPGVTVAQTSPAPTREEIRPDRLTPGTGPSSDRLEVEGGIERAPCPLAQPRFAAIRFRLNDAVFANLRGIPAERLRPAFADYIGQDVPIAIVCDIRDRAASILRSEGYLAAVQVPPQQIGDDGVVRFDVLMASMSRIQVRGDAGNSENLIARYLQPLSEMEVFNQRRAERSLLLARNLPGFETRLTLRPAENVPGEVIGDVRVERTPLILEGNIQNYASRSTGRFGGQIRAQINDITGLGDSTALAFFSSADFDEQLVVNASHSFAIGGNGLRLGGAFTYAWNDPTIGGVSPFDTQTLVAGIDLSYPFILDQATSLVGTAGFDFIDQDVRFGGVDLNRDKLRVVYARAALYTTDRRSIDGIAGYSAAEPRWRFGIAGEIRQGLDIFDATEPGVPATGVAQTRAAGKADATVLRIDGLAELRPVPDIAFVIEPRLQWTSDPLLSYEEFSGGNYTVGRGFDPGSVIGDRGIGFRYEFRYGSALPRTRESWAFQPYGFFDAAWVGNEDPAALGGTGSDELYSTGIGVRANYGDRARLDTTFAIPLNRTNFQTSRPSPRLLLSLLLRFAR